jgi:type II secretory pathway pseudopilin PulG
MRRIKKISRQAGFTLLEMLLVVAILMTVMAIVVQGITQLQRRNASEVAKMDINQESREFLDQITRDLHQAGYPSWKTFPSAIYSNTADESYYAVGLTSVAQDKIVFEGDTDGNGQVETETIQVVGSDGNYPPTAGCPCTIQRGTVNKSAGGTPTYYTEVNNLLNSAPFTAYNAAGSSVTLPLTLSPTVPPWTNGTPTSLSNCSTPANCVKTIRINLQVQSPNKDLTDKVAPVASMFAQATIVN